MCDHIAYCERNELKAENDRLRAQLASRQIDIDTFREGNQNLRAELANAKLERDNIASLNSSLIARLAAAKARIAELETDHLFAENKRLREACQEFRARAERAEAELKSVREGLA